MLGPRCYCKDVPLLGESHTQIASQSGGYRHRMQSRCVHHPGEGISSDGG